MESFLLAETSHFISIFGNDRILETENLALFSILDRIY